MDAPWRIQLFGELRLQRGDHVVSRFATSRVAALLARLALFPRRTHPREELIDLLWPDSDLDAGRLSLRVAVASLRRQMEPPELAAGSVLVADRSSVRLNPLACRCDVGEFEAALASAARAPSPEKRRDALDRAVALYGSELLPGFYDDWIVEERERLTALYEEAVYECESLPQAAPALAPAPPEGVGAVLGHGFPLRFTRFFGREEECAEVGRLLRAEDTRLVTMTGPGGAGKTRLAGEVARQVRGDFPGPVCFVGLADLDDAHLIAGAVADALGLPPPAGQEPLEQVVAALAAGPPALLVLDNFEQLVERGAAVVLSLLSRVPALTCLVTSRRRLGLPGEREYPVPPLPLPLPAPPEGHESPEFVAQAASAQLFVDRAQAARPDFQLTRGNAGAVAALCRDLEGIPLAIELVAARALSLSPAQMRERLAQRFELLTSRRGDKNGRHRSLWAAIAWSFDLLGPAQRRFFVQLSVFRGGFTADAAQAVCEEDEALEFLTQLRERSLINVEESGMEMRFRLLESLREFAGEHLSDEEHQALGRRHAAYFQSLAARAEALWAGPQQDRAREMLDAETDNLRAALAFCRPGPPGQGVEKGGWDGEEVGLRLAGSLGHYWNLRGMLREGVDWLEGALAGGGSDRARARALAEAGWLAGGLGEYGRAEPLLTEAMALSRRAGDRAELVRSLRLRGTVSIWQDHNAEASADLEEALALSRADGDENSVALTLNGLGVLANQWPGDSEKARRLYEESLAIFRRRGDRQRMSYSLHNLGNIAHETGDDEQAETMLRESLALAEALGDLWHRAYCLRSLGDVALARGDLSGAALILEEGQDLCRRLGDRSSEAGTVCSLASVAVRRGESAQADALFGSALLLYRDLGNTRGLWEVWMGMAEAAASGEHWARAASLLAAAAACPDVPCTGEMRSRFEAAREAAREALGPDAFGSAWEQGCGLTPEDAAL